ncbi:FAR1 DNA binding domain-containing protein [Artemisia annua]|uniref:FAR1 DNA binding domain-containing protein n=1 Tax=Artemisia annua TaxID=35608 RepID=A0A2U1K8J3_ARTAN|nr:FAR1 DNA binding domain-containing protein [Artemisia annua]
MEKQRYIQERLDHNSIDSFPALLTPLAIEVHATRFYTRKLFVLVQKEIIAGSWLCSIMSKTYDELCDVPVISEEKSVPGTIPEVVDEEDSTSENVEEELILYQKDIRRVSITN